MPITDTLNFTRLTERQAKAPFSVRIRRKRGFPLETKPWHAWKNEYRNSVPARTSTLVSAYAGWILLSQSLFTTRCQQALMILPKSPACHLHVSEGPARNLFRVLVVIMVFAHLEAFGLKLCTCREWLQHFLYQIPRLSSIKQQACSRTPVDTRSELPPRLSLPCRSVVLPDAISMPTGMIIAPGCRHHPVFAAAVGPRRDPCSTLRNTKTSKVS